MFMCQLCKGLLTVLHIVAASVLHEGNKYWNGMFSDGLMNLDLKAWEMHYSDSPASVQAEGRFDQSHWRSSPPYCQHNAHVLEIKLEY